MNEKQVAELLVSAGIVKTDFEKGYKWTSGIVSPIYCDCRLLIGLPGQRSDIINAMIAKTQTLTEQPHAVAGTATAGIPWAAWVADKLARPMLYVRKKPKGHGGGKQVEGCVSDSCTKILLIEDAISTGGSALGAVRALRGEFSAQVTDIVSIFSWDLPQSQKLEAENDFRVHALTSVSFIAQALLDLGRISEQEKEKLAAFHKSL